ncbi:MULTISPECIES: non-ribosomal peptide synthetase [Streptomyces]|uniref:non-ribosomal peptide synthetase n=1 Tax=Streptomyces TaxID=1883 RepID=UPI0022495FED|nr:non-ribosomal peptide synthetase [Streptomyces sp. JHD 1]MCX2969316.1 amino acid adenylation domain-containing protein [Streptomyces sp. JHD 1]
MAEPTAMTSVVEAFEAQRARRPDAPAVTGDFGTLSYARLGGLADAVAAAVTGRAAGGPAPRVGYLGARDPHFLAVLLGVLGSGAAYVPLDPAWPAARLAEVAEDAGMTWVFTDAEHAGAAAEAGLPGVLPVAETLAGSGSGADGSAASPRPRAGGATDLAYVVYTSGSTGRPKGVLTEHGPLLNTCRGMAELWRLTPEDRVLQFTTLGVDITMEEAFTAWTAGGALVLMGPATTTDLSRFTDFLAAHRVSALDLPTSFWTTWLDAVERGDAPVPPATVRVVAVGSEEVHAEDIGRWLAVARPGCQVFNMYGSTEQAITSLVHGPLEAGDPVGTGVVGTPLPGVRAYVLDADLNRLPPGRPGELHVGGLAAARGYAGRPGRTAARFRPDPFAGVPGARMYATGDRAVALRDGTFRFAGRIDGRLKIRGFTVQPGEVRLVLADVHGVDRVAVAAEPGPDGRDRVVATVSASVPADGVGELVAALTRRAAERLPEAARPRQYTVHVPGEDAPVVRPAAGAGPTAPAGQAAPGTTSADPRRAEVTAAVTALWQELLGPQDVAPGDSFLDLGGNSLLVTQLLTRLRGRLGVTVELADFFATPTVEAVTTAVLAAGERSPGTGAGPAAEPVRPSTALEGPCWPGQERMWFLQRLMPESIAYHLPLAFEVSGTLDRAALRAALHTVLRRHEPLRTAVRLEEGRLVQSVREPEAHVEEATSRHSAVEEARRPDGFAAAFVARPFDLASGRMLRTAVLDCADDRALLLFVVHHTAFDEWSAGLFLDELSRAYAAAVRGHDADLPELAVRYLDFSAGQTAGPHRRRLAEQRDFWRAYLADLPPEPTLPADSHRPRRGTQAGAECAFTVPPREAAALAALARREGVTRFHALLALYCVFLARHTGRHDFAVGVPVANRDAEGLEALIGLFVNTLPVRARLTDNPRFTEAVRRLGESTLAALGAKEVPVDEIARAVGAHGGGAGDHPLFQTMFLMDEEPTGSLTLPDADVAPLTLPVRANTLDLTLVLGDDDRGGLAGRLWYSTELFGAETAGRLVAGFLALVRQAVADPELRVRDLDFVPAEHRALTAAPAAAPAAPAAVADTPAVRVAAAARRFPERPALTSRGTTLTHARLAARTAALRQRLLDADPTGAPVLPVLPDGPELLAATLAADGLGRINAALDPARLPVPTAPWAELGGGCVVTSGDLDRDRLPPGLPVVHVPDSGAEVPATTGSTATTGAAAPPAGGPSPDAAPAHGAGPAGHVTFTDGPGGDPRAVHLPPGALAPAWAWLERELGAEVLDGALFSTPAPDGAHLAPRLWALAHGGHVVTGPGPHAAPDRLLAALTGQDVRTLFLAADEVHALLRHLAARPDAAGALTGVRAVVVRGGQAPSGLAKRCAELGLSARLYQLYGPPEAAGAALWRRITPEEPGEVPAFRPLDGSAAAVLDERRLVVPHGVPGELYLAGDALASGHPGDAAATRRAFVTNRFPGVLPGDRLLRTGRVARLRPSGEVELPPASAGAPDGAPRPAALAALLEAHAGVRRAQVVAGPAPDARERLRERVAALVEERPADLVTAAVLRVTGARGHDGDPNTTTPGR